MRLPPRFNSWYVASIVALLLALTSFSARNVIGSVRDVPGAGDGSIYSWRSSSCTRFVADLAAADITGLSLTFLTLPRNRLDDSPSYPWGRV